MKYGNFSDYETWLVFKRNNPKTANEVMELKQRLEKEFDSMPDSIFKDMIGFELIGWDEMLEFVESNN